MLTRWKVAAVGLGGLVALVGFLGGDARGQKKPVESPVAKQAKDNRLNKSYYGLAGCRQGAGDGGCHNRATNDPLPARSRDLVCRSNEIKFWLDHDKHATAYKVLITNIADAKGYVAKDRERYTEKDWAARKNKESAEEVVANNARARLMEAILKQTPRAKAIEKKTGKAYKLTTDPDCLACHAQVIKEEDKRFVTESFHLEEGVNCVICHGPYSNWVTEHLGIPGGFAKWRKYDRVKKETGWGMTDLWDPAKRTKLCASCHVGHQGDANHHRKFVTHEMYAAGHPPLPGFEVAAFSNEMPRHWDYIREKNAKVLKYQQIDKNNFEFEQTQLVLIGATATLAESMRLLAGLAQDAFKDDEKALDLSNFDCYACHHDLAKDSWRKQRGYGDHRPGRIPMRPWMAELVRLAIRYLETTPAGVKKREEALEGKLTELKKAFTERVNGNPGAIMKAATDLATWADELTADIVKKSRDKPCTKEEAVALYRAIPDLFQTAEPKKWLDFDSARQVGWGFKIIYLEAQRLDWDGKRENKTGALADLQKIDVFLKLRLPAAPKSIDSELGKTMDARNSYHPRDFRKLMQALGTALKAEK